MPKHVKPALTPSVNVVQKPGVVDPVAVEVIAQDILAISDAMSVLNSSRLKKNAITLLIQAACPVRISKDTIDMILGKLTDLKSLYLK